MEKPIQPSLFDYQPPVVKKPRIIDLITRTPYRNGMGEPLPWEEDDYVLKYGKSSED